MTTRAARSSAGSPSPSTRWGTSSSTSPATSSASLMGSGTQLLIPVIVMIVFLRQPDYFGVAVGGFWLSYSMFDLGALRRRRAADGAAPRRLHRRSRARLELPPRRRWGCCEFDTTIAFLIRILAGRGRHRVARVRGVAAGDDGEIASVARAPHPAFGHLLPAHAGRRHSDRVRCESLLPSTRGEGGRRPDEGRVATLAMTSPPRSPRAAPPRTPPASSSPMP